MSTKSFKKSSKSRKGKASKKSRLVEASGPSAQMQVYRGPLIGFGTSNNTDTLTVSLHEVSSTFFVSSAGGTMDLVINMTPSTAADWSQYSGAWRECRLLGARVEYKPNDRYSKTTTVTRPMISVVDHATASASPLGSYSAAIAFASAKDVSLDDFFHTEWRMSGSEEAGFKDITAPGTFGHVYYYSTGLSVSQAYGLVVIRWLVQFRGRA